MTPIRRVARRCRPLLEWLERRDQPGSLLTAPFAAAPWLELDVRTTSRDNQVTQSSSGLLRLVNERERAPGAPATEVAVPTPSSAAANRETVTVQPSVSEAPTQAANGASLLLTAASVARTVPDPTPVSVVVNTAEDGLAHPPPGFHMTTFAGKPHGGLLGPGPQDLLYSSYFGGVGNDEISTVALDAQNNTYVIGTFDNGNPALGSDVFVAKLRPDGSPAWATVFGGSGPSRGTGIDVDPQGNVYICGTFTNSLGGQTSFVGKLNPDGSQFLWRRSIPAVVTADTLPNGVTRIRYDAQRNQVYYAGFLTVALPGGEQRLAGGLGRLSATDGSPAPYSMITYYFPSHIDMIGTAAGFDGFGSAYFANQLVDYDQGQTGTFIAKLSFSPPELYQLVWYHTYSADGTNAPTALVTESTGTSYLVGYVTTPEKGLDLEEMKHDSGGHMIYDFRSPIVKGSPATAGEDLVIDAQGRSYAPGFFTTASGNQNVFLTRITPRQVGTGYEFDLDTITFGGSGDDRGLTLAAQLNPTQPGYAVVAGVTNSLDFPVTPDAYQPQYGGGDSDGFIARTRLPGT